MWICKSCKKKNEDIIRKCQCGFDNTKNYIDYYTLTELQEEERDGWQPEMSAAEQLESEHGKKWKKWIVAAVGIFVLVLILLLGSRSEEKYSITLEQGEYVVGVHIPEGVYTATGDGWIYVKDQDKILRLSENLDAGVEIKNIRLYNGELVLVSNYDELCTLTTSNAQKLEYPLLENPLEEGSIQVHDGAIAGEDFEPGVYNLYVTGEFYMFDIDIKDSMADGYTDTIRNIPIKCSGQEKDCYVNLVLPEGAVINIEKTLPTLRYDIDGVYLKPSEGIIDEDYRGYYDKYD